MKEILANAQFIIRAANSHDDLVAACEALVKFRRPTKRDWDNGAVRDEFDAIVEAAKDALKKAKAAAN